MAKRKSSKERVKMSLLVDPDVAADLTELTAARKAHALRRGKPSVRVSDVVNEVLRKGIDAMKKNRP